jgi:anaerobic ribonucleoside-triphosphate reductase activating protein
MLRYIRFDIVFQEVPGEVTLAIHIANCPNRCQGCHSPHLQEDTGEALDEPTLAAWIDAYGDAITCICFMGGDADPHEVGRLAGFVKRQQGRTIRTAWYSGRASVADGIALSDFDYIKLGAYVEHLGGLDHPATNQRFYCIEKGEMIDGTNRFQKHKN